jgi:hypothetical protein
LQIVPFIVPCGDRAQLELTGCGSNCVDDGWQITEGGENVVALTKKELIALGLLLLAILALTLMSENIVVV